MQGSIWSSECGPDRREYSQVRYRWHPISEEWLESVLLLWASQGPLSPGYNRTSNSCIVCYEQKHKYRWLSNIRYWGICPRRRFNFSIGSWLHSAEQNTIYMGWAWQCNCTSVPLAVSAPPEQNPAVRQVSLPGSVLRWLLAVGQREHSLEWAWYTLLWSSSFLKCVGRVSLPLVVVAQSFAVKGLSLRGRFHWVLATGWYIGSYIDSLPTCHVHIQSYIYILKWCTEK